MADIKIRRWYHHDCTIGRLTCGTFQCMTLELPYLNNQRDISCIPPWDYPYITRLSPKNGEVLELDNVPGRTYIQMHSANFTSQLEGCIAVGEGIIDINHDGVLDVTNSKATLCKLLDVAGTSGRVFIT